MITTEQLAALKVVAVAAQADMTTTNSPAAQPKTRCRRTWKTFYLESGRAYHETESVRQSWARREVKCG